MFKKILFTAFFIIISLTKMNGQNFGEFASSLIMDTNVVNPNDGPQGIQDWFCLTTCDASNPNTIFPNSANLNGVTFGTRIQYSNSLQLDGGEFKTFKNAIANVCGIDIYYRFYPQGTTPPSFSVTQITTVKADCDSGAFNDGFGPCADGDQKWQVGENFAGSAPQFNIDITRSCGGLNVFEMYYVIRGSNTSTSSCNETVTINNNGLNYIATYTLTSNLSATVSGPTNTLCVGQTVQLGVSNIVKTNPNTVTFAWTGPNGYSSNQQNPSFTSTINSSGTYTCVVTDSCGLQYTDSVTVTINPLTIPTFAFINSITLCSGQTAPVLATTSVNGISGTWNVTTINTNTSGIYTFTPTTGQCASNFSVNVTVNTTPPTPVGSVTFQPTCENQLGTITLTSPIAPLIYPNLFISEVTDEEIGSLTYVELFNGTGTTVNLSNYKVRVYNNGNTNASCSLDLTGSLANNSTYVIRIGSTTNVGGVVPNVSFPTCAGINTNDNIRLTNLANATIDNWGRTDGVDFTPSNLPGYTYRRKNDSNPPFTGWNPNHWIEFDPQVYDNVGQYTAATSNQYTYSLDGINYQNGLIFTNIAPGTYSVTVRDNNTSCVSNPLTLIVNSPPILFTPTFDFGNNLTICSGENVPLLPTTSSNGIEGLWNILTVSNSQSGSYIFTPNISACATNFTFDVMVNPLQNPTFDFGNNLTICSGENVPLLPTTSSNGIEGSWNNITVSNTQSGSYVFTPNASACASNFTFDVTVNPLQNPTFDFGNNLTICSGENVPLLPTTSSNGIQGAWNNITVSNTQSGSYVFTPNASACASNFTFDVTVNPLQNPTFDFGNSLTICSGENVPLLPTTSSNGIQGAWNNITVSNTQTGSYVFTPNTSACASNFTFDVTVNPLQNPTFDFGNSLTICSGENVPLLPTTSSNGIQGSWNILIVSNTQSETYIFTSINSACTNATFTFDVTVNQLQNPTFDFGNTLTICAGGNVPLLPTISSNGIQGSWNILTVSNSQSGSYVFTPNASACASNFTFDVTVNPLQNPTFDFGNSLTICSGENVPLLPTTSSNGIQGSWNIITVSNTQSGSYVFTPNASACASNFTFDVTVNPTFDFVINGLCINEKYELQISGEPSDATYTWLDSNGNPIGNNANVLNVSNLLNATTQIETLPITYQVRIESASGCSVTKSYVVENIFCGIQKGISANGDGSNDFFDLTLLAVNKLSIYNRYGRKVYTKQNYRNEWYGKTDDNKNLPSGTYYYVIELENGDVKTGWIYVITDNLN